MRLNSLVAHLQIHQAARLVDLDFSELEKRVVAMDLYQAMSRLWDGVKGPKPDTIYRWPAGAGTHTRTRVGKSVFWRNWWAYHNFPKILNPEPEDALRAAVLWAIKDLRHDPS